MVDALVRACMRTPQAARYIAISKSRLSQLRMTGEGPPFIKIGPKAVAYRRADLNAWLESRLRRTLLTSNNQRIAPWRALEMRAPPRLQSEATQKEVLT